MYVVGGEGKRQDRGGDIQNFKNRNFGRKNSAGGEGAILALAPMEEINPTTNIGGREEKHISSKLATAERRTQ